jgi:hypothetical protein
MSHVTLALVVTLCVTLSAAVPQEWAFPHTKKSGRATSEYRDDNGFHVVVNYDYSQRNHKTPWLLVDMALAATNRFVLHKDNIRLVTPDGRELRVATQEAMIADSQGITFVVQNAKIFRQPVENYFSQRGARESIRFQVLPGQGTTSDEAVVDNDRVALGAVFFRSPEGLWQSATYRLVVDNEKAKAALPIVLE